MTLVMRGLGLTEPEGVIVIGTTEVTSVAVDLPPEIGVSAVVYDALSISVELPPDINVGVLVVDDAIAAEVE